MCYIKDMIKKNTKAFADILLRDGKISAQKAYLMTHETENKATARVNASQLLSKPEVQIYMEQHVDKAKAKVVELIDSDDQSIALRASDSVLDRNLGRPLTRTNNVNISVSIEEALNSLI